MAHNRQSANICEMKEYVAKKEQRQHMNLAKGVIIVKLDGQERLRSKKATFTITTNIYWSHT